MFTHKVLLAVVVLCWTLESRSCYSAAAQECNVIQKAYELCSSDERCVYTMGIDEQAENSLLTFRYLYEQLIYIYDIESSVQYYFCTEPSQAAAAAAVEEEMRRHMNKVLLAIMRDYHYCEDHNQYFDRDQGCVCRRGKLCAQAYDHTFYVGRSRYLAWAIVGLVVILGASLFYRLFVQRQQLRELVVASSRVSSLGVQERGSRPSPPAHVVFSADSSATPGSADGRPRRR